MKRSEMLNEIAYSLINADLTFNLKHQKSNQPPLTYEYANFIAYYILGGIEQKGMLPPTAEFTSDSKEWYLGLGNRHGKLIEFKNQWEPENEEK